MALFVNRTHDSVAGAFVRWNTAAPDTVGASYPGPGVFGVTAVDYCVEGIVEGGDTSSTLARIGAVTGVLSGGLVTVNGGDPAKFDVAAGTGLIMDFTNPDLPVPTFVSFGPFIAEDPLNLGTEAFTGLTINAAGTLVKSNSGVTTAERRDTILLQTALHVDMATITSVSSNQQPAWNVTQGVLDYIGRLGPINTGNDYSANGVNLSIDKTAGTTSQPFINFTNDSDAPNDLANPSQTAPAFLESLRDGSGGYNFTGAPSVFVDVANYDTNDISGTPQAVAPAGRFQIKRFFYFGAVNTVVLTYGQALYTSIADAEAAIFSENPDNDPILETGCFCYALIVAGNATDLSDSADAKFVKILNQTTGSGGSVTDLQGAYNLSGTVSLDVDGGNTLLFDSAVPHFAGAGLFVIARDTGSSEFTGLLAPDSPADSVNPGTALLLIAANGSNQTTSGTGQLGGDSGGMQLGNFDAGFGSAASGSGTAAGNGGIGGTVLVNLGAGGAGGAGSGSDNAGGGGNGSSFELTATAGDGGAGGAGTASVPGGVGGDSGHYHLFMGAGGIGGAGSATQAAGDGGNAQGFQVSTGAGGDAGAANGGAGGDGGDGSSILFTTGGGGNLTGSGTQGNAGNIDFDPSGIGATEGAVRLLNNSALKFHGPSNSTFNSFRQFANPVSTTEIRLPLDQPVTGDVLTVTSGGATTQLEWAAAAGASSLQAAYDVAGAINLDVTGGNDLKFDSVPAEASGLGLFNINREMGSGEFTFLKAPDQLANVSLLGTTLALFSGGGSSRTTVGAPGSASGSVFIGGFPGLGNGGAGGPASGSGTAGGGGGGGAAVELSPTPGGIGGAGLTGDDGGQGGDAGSISITSADGAVGGAAGTTSTGGNGGNGSDVKIGNNAGSGTGGAGGDASAVGSTAGNGGVGTQVEIGGGTGGAAGSPGSGSTGLGGPGGRVALIGGEGGSGNGGTDGVGGACEVDSGAGAGSAAAGLLLIGTSNATNIESGNGDTDWEHDGVFTLKDATPPGAPAATLGSLYKKAADTGLFWHPTGGSEVDLTPAGSDLQTAYTAGGTVALDVTGGNDLTWDSSTPDPAGVGLFTILRNEGAGEGASLVAPSQPDDVANDGSPLLLLAGAGSDQNAATGVNGTDSGAVTIGAFLAFTGVGGDGGGASGAGAAGGDGGTGVQINISTGGGGAAGAASGTDAGGTGGQSGTITLTIPDATVGGAGSASAVAGAGGTAGSIDFVGGDGGDAGANNGGGGNNGGVGTTITVTAGGGGAATGAGTDGDGGALQLTGGDGGGSNADGGAIILDPGVGVGTGVDGVVLLSQCTMTISGMTAPAVSAAGTCRLYFDSGTNKLRISENTGAYVDVV